MKIAIAGASGFVGGAILAEWTGRHELIALSRAEPAQGHAGVEWRQCDLFQPDQVRKALEGTDVAVYLVHSMLPTARLSQARFEDLDLILADSFGRGAQAAGVRRIVYLGGLAPENERLSRHLESRIEVERALGAHGVPVTTLRSGLILGAQGSSFQMLYLLVRRLPVMLCPRWTETRLHCVGLRDVLRFLEFSLDAPGAAGRTFEIGCRDSISYRGLLEATARALRLKRRFFSIPVFSPGLSRLWVQLITGASAALAKPLVQSLRHAMLVRDRSIETLSGLTPLNMQEALDACVRDLKPELRAVTRARNLAARKIPDVRSVQRLPRPAGLEAASVGREYIRWLSSLLRPVIQAREAGTGVWAFHGIGIGEALLVLEEEQDPLPSSTSACRSVLRIRGGLLVRTADARPGRLEFTTPPHQPFVMAAVHDFVPALPWMIYRWTQALAHLWIMRAFGRHLERLPQDRSRAPSTR